MNVAHDERGGVKGSNLLAMITLQMVAVVQRVVIGQEGS